MSEPPTSTSSLLFPSAAVNINKLSSALSKSSLSITNRLHSIDADARFVAQTARVYGLPVVSNERCGSWYVDPELKTGSAYFKSTDGHFGQWSFSLRRLNLQILDIVGTHGGCIIVDSTRRGKHLPDALSKTVPIWCGVMNQLLFPSRTDSIRVERLAELVSESEHAQIEARLQGFIEQVHSLGLDLVNLRAKVSKPLKPVWIARSLGLPGTQEQDSHTHTSHHMVYLCMASSYQDSAYTEASTGYVQGAGDDNEAWSRGLTSAMYWKYKEELLAASEDNISGLIEKLLERDNRPYVGTVLSAPIRPTQWLRLGALPQGAEGLETGCLVVICAPDVSMNLVEGLGKKLLHLKCVNGKLGSRDLRKELLKVPNFIQAQQCLPSVILVCCNTGKDLSVGVALALLCSYTDADGNLLLHHRDEEIDKTVIRRKLSWIMTSLPEANPSRATLNAVNAFLMRQPA